MNDNLNSLIENLD